MRSGKIVTAPVPLPRANNLPPLRYRSDMSSRKPCREFPHVRLLHSLRKQEVMQRSPDKPRVGSSNTTAGGKPPTAGKIAPHRTPPPLRRMGNSRADR